MKLGERLSEEMPINVLIAKCGVCGMELFHSHKGDIRITPKECGDVISMEQKGHFNDTGHDDLQVHIDKPEPTTDPDYTIYTE